MQVPAASPLTVGTRLRAIVSGSIGNLVEWYDWYVYSAFALYFAPAFFPKGDATAQLLNSAAVFAVGFLMRPLGGWLLGAYADRHGRRAALLLSVLLMCAGSLLIALTPGYDRIGVGAPVLLVLARLLQGLSVGGEYGTSATYLSETADAANRGFYSSFQYVTLLGGQLLALTVQLGLQATLTESQLYAWGWRVPFALGAAAALTALYLRRAMVETAAFEAEAAFSPQRAALPRVAYSQASRLHGRPNVAGGTPANSQHGRDARVDPAAAPADVLPAPDGPLRALLRHPRELLTVVGLTLGGTIAFYTFTTYPQKFLVNTAGFTKEQATQLSFWVLVLALLIQPLLGALSDRIGRKPVLLWFGIGATLGTVPLLTALSQARTMGAAFGLLAVAILIVSGYTSINAVVKAELFPTRVRALGVGLPHAVTVAIFGGTVEYVALLAKSHGHESAFYWYVTACAAFSLAVYGWMPDTKKTSRITD